MTKTTGARARQRRREELFSAEMMLRRVLLHLLNALSWPGLLGMLPPEYVGAEMAYEIVRHAYRAVLDEQKAGR